jgi:hypothetical protein
MRPRSRKWDEKKTFMISSGSFRKASMRLLASLPLSNGSTVSPESESVSSDTASPSGVASLSGAGVCWSRPIYMRNWKTVRQRVICRG